MAAPPLRAVLCSFRFALPLICRFGQRLFLPSISSKTDILLCRMGFCSQDCARNRSSNMRQYSMASARGQQRRFV
jgi:hypothetical protein